MRTVWKMLEKEREQQRGQLPAYLLAARESERKHISRRLYDGLAQCLVLIKLRLASIDNGLVDEEGRHLLAFIDGVIDDLRGLSRELNPTLLEDVGLSVALAALVENHCKDSRATVTLPIVGVDRVFSAAAQIVIYRAIQEALSNIARHARAEHVSLVVEWRGDRVIFLVEDDGKGFDVKEAMRRDGPERGWGLAIMDERARMLGGTLSVWSVEGRGTRITLDIPAR